MKAIILPYCVDQNEPSRPLNKIYDLPDDVKLRNKLLTELAVETLNTDPDNKFKVRKGKSDDFGDLVVYDQDCYCLLYVTFIKS